MNQSNIPAENQLNPFAFPSETESLFLLLVVAIASCTLVLGDALVGSVVTTNRLLSFLTALGIALFVFIWAWYRAQRDAINTIKQRQWKAFPPPNSDPCKEASLKRMQKYIGEIVKVTPGLVAASPILIWDDTSEGSDCPRGRAFGFNKQKYLCLKQGLHDAFIQLPQSRTFDAVLLHELGHIANRDVNKITFSIALGKCFFPTAVIILILLEAYLYHFTLNMIQIVEKLLLTVYTYDRRSQNQHNRNSISIKKTVKATKNSICIGTPSSIVSTKNSPGRDGAAFSSGVGKKSSHSTTLVAPI